MRFLTCGMWNRANEVEHDLLCYFSFLIRLTLCIQTKYQARIQAKTNTDAAPRVTLLTLPHTKPGKVSNNVLCNSIPLLLQAEDSHRRDTPDTQSRRPELTASHTVLVKAFDLLLNCKRAQQADFIEGKDRRPSGRVPAPHNSSVALKRIGF
jgi:hypothetical protein